MRIDIKGDIIPNNYKWVYDYLELEAVCPRDVLAVLGKAAGSDVNVYINSGGGDVYSGVEIYAALRDYAGPLSIHIVGVAASAASIIACAGKSDITPGGMVMLHTVSAKSGGNHEDHSNAAKALRKHDASIAGIYALKTGLNENEIIAMLNNETWLTAQEAVDTGFVDAVAKEALRPVAAACMSLPPGALEKIRNLIKNPPENSADNFMRDFALARLKLLQLQGGIIN